MTGQTLAAKIEADLVLDGCLDDYPHLPLQRCYSSTAYDLVCEQSLSTTLH